MKILKNLPLFQVKVPQDRLGALSNPPTATPMSPCHYSWIFLFFLQLSYTFAADGSVIFHHFLVYPKNQQTKKIQCKENVVINKMPLQTEVSFPNSRLNDHNITSFYIGCIFF